MKFQRQDWRNSEGKLLTFPENTTIGNDANTQYTENLPIEIVKSVNINEGFYIARFEAGQPVEEKTVSKQGIKVYNNVTWNVSKTLAESIYLSTDIKYGVISTLVYGTQWDTALKFIESYDIGELEYDIYLKDSTGMGNYSEGDEFVSIATCGASEEFRQKNIYDMAGNVWEWTMEEYNTKFVTRGGSYGNLGSSFPASYRHYRSNMEEITPIRRFSYSIIYKINSISSIKTGLIFLFKIYLQLITSMIK